jgi:flagellar M-ring protein FliF
VVIDDNGKLLSATPEAAGAGDVQQLQYVQQIEQLYSKRIMDILSPWSGATT